MFKVVAQYLVDQETTSNYYGRDYSDSSIVNNYGSISNEVLTIFDDTVVDQSLKLIDPALNLSDNSAGSFEFTLPECNVAYGHIGRMVSEIIVYQADTEIWRGRVLSEEMDFQNRKKYYCEGELAYLNDTMIPPCDYKDYDIGQILRQIIDAHNSQIANEFGANKYNGIDKYFVIGAVEIHNQKNNEEFQKESSFTTNYEKTLEIINNITDSCKGHIQIRHQNGVRYIDFLQDLKFGAMAGQTINFGENLLDFTRTFDMSKICTAVLALGKLPSDFKPKDKELASHSGAFDSCATFLAQTGISKWIDGFGLYDISQFIVARSYVVTPGKTYIISNRLPTGMVSMSFIDANGNFLSNTKHDGNQWNLKKFSVPSDCTAMSVANYGSPPYVILAPDQESEIKVPTGKDLNSVATNVQVLEQIYDQAGVDTSSQSQSQLPDIRDIIGTNNPNDYTTYYNDYLQNQGTSQQQSVPINNRERYVTYKVAPVLGGPGQILTSAIIEDRDIINYGLQINTIRIDVHRDKVDEEVKYIYTARMDYPFMVYAILDAGGAILESKTVTEIVEKDRKHNDFIEEIITVPPRGVTLYVSSQVNGDNGGVFDFHVWSYNKLYDKVNMYLTVEEINNGNPYVVNNEAIQTYGWIAKSIEFEVEDKQTLLSKARQYLQEVQFDHIELEVSAADLAYVSSDYRPFRLYELVRCVSVPHGLDKKFPVTAIQMPLDKPDQFQYTLGDDKEPDYTEANNDTEIDLIDIINKIPSRESVLVEARRNATEIMNRYCHGYVTIVEDDPRFGSCIYIADSEDYTSANRMWLWSLNGLGYSNDGGQTFGLAMTMDGSIVADYITAGTMNADRIRSGLLIDLEGKNYWNLETGDIALGLNLKTTKIQNADSYYGSENGDNNPTSNANIELGSWIYDRTNHDHNFRSMFGSGTNLVEGIYGFSGPVKDENNNPVLEDWYNPKTGLTEKREKQRYWLYISASMVTTGILRGKNGRLWFDLNSGSLWVAGPSRLELNPNGDVLYPDGNGGWTTTPSAVEKHIKFEEGALFGYSGAQWSAETSYYEVGGEYSTKDQSMADIGHDQGAKHRIFTTTNMTGGTCEGFLDLVSTYGTDNQDNKQYDVLLAGSNRVHINFGNSLLIGQSRNLFDIDPYILVTASQKVFAIGDVERPANKVNLEVYGDAQIGHKLEDIGNEDSGAMDSTGHAPDKTTADKYKGDLVVNGSATFGRNYYTEEVTQTNSTATSSATTRRSGDSVIATGTTQTPGANTQVTKKVYYDDVTFYANVTIEGDGVTSMDHLDVGYNMAVGTQFGTNLYSMWDHSWKFTNEGESYSTEKSYSDSNLDASTDPDNFNSINGDLLINGKVQFVGGTVGLPDGRLVIGARESGTSGAYSVDHQVSYETGMETGYSDRLMKNYYGLIGLTGEGKIYDIYNSRFVVEGNSILFGDIHSIGGILFAENFSIREYAMVEYYEQDQNAVLFNPIYALDYDSCFKRFLISKPFIFLDSTDPSVNIKKYYKNWLSSYGAIPHGLYFEEGIPIKTNSAIYYEGDNTSDGFVISATNRNNTLNHSERLTNTYRITLKGSTFFEDGPMYVNTSISYTGSSAEGLVIEADSTTNQKNATERSDASKRITLKSSTYVKDTNLYLQEGTYTRGTLHSTGRIDTRCIDLTSFSDNAKDSSNANYSLDGSSGLGILAARKVILFGTNTSVNGYGSGTGPQAYVYGDGASHFTSVGVGGYVGGNYFDYISLSGSNGTVNCRTLTISAWNTSDKTVTRSWTPFSTHSTTVNYETVYKLKLSCSEGEFDDYVKIGNTTLREVEKVNNSLTNNSTSTLLHFSRGIAPSCIDVTDRTQYEGASSGSIYTRNLYAVDSSHSRVAKIDESGNVGAIAYQIKSGENWNTLVNSSGKGFFAGVQSTSTISVVEGSSTLARLDSTGNVSGLSYQIKSNGSWTTLVDSAGKGFFKGLSSNGSVSVTGSISATGNISTNANIAGGEVCGTSIATASSNGAVGVTRISSDGSATLNTVTCNGISCTNVSASGDITASGNGKFGYLYIDDVQLYHALAITGQDYISINGYYGFNAYELRTGGTIRIDVYGNVANSSDIKLKKDIKEFDKSAIEMIESVPVKSFTWKDSNKKVLAGFIAQDMEYIDKKYTDESYMGLVNTSNDTKTITVNGLVPILWKAVQELSQEVKELKEALRNGRNQ